MYSRVVRPTLLLAFSAISLATLLAQTSNEFAVDIPFEKFVTASGLTVIVHEDHSVPLVSVNVWYRVGSKDERPGRSGFAHLFEHLLLAAHQNITSRLVSAGAVEANGTYGNDATEYYAMLPSSSLDLLLYFQSQLMGHSQDAITQTVLDKERGIVKNEKRESEEDRSYGRVPNLIAQASYPVGHPYALTGAGSLQDLDAANLEDVRSWLAANYGPANAVLVVAGDVDLGTIRQKIQKFFGDIPPGPLVATPAPWVAKAIGRRRQVMYDRIPSARVYRVWNIPEWSVADTRYLSLVSSVLGGGSSSRLHRRLVQSEQIATDVSASVRFGQLGSQLSIQVTAKSERDLAAIESALDEEVTRFVQDGPTMEEREAVRRRFLTDFFRGTERLGSEWIGGFKGKSWLLAENEVLGGRPDYYKVTLDRVARATSDDLRDAARRWLVDSDVTLVLRPRPMQPAASASNARPSEIPEAGEFPSVTLAPMQQKHLANGLRVLFVEHPAVPLVEMRLIVSSGSASDRDGAPGAAELTAKLLVQGTTRRTAAQISDDVLDLSARLSTSTQTDTSAVALAGPSGELVRMLDVLADIVRHPTFPATALEAQRQQYASRVQRERGSTVTPERLMPRLLERPAATPGTPVARTSSEGAAAGRDELLAFHSERYRPNNATLVVVGATTMEKLLPEIDRAFGTWERGPLLPSVTMNVTEAVSRVVYLVDAPGMTQSVVVAGMPAPLPADPSYHAFRTIAIAMRSRLFANLREAKQWSYAPYTSLAGTRDSQVFMLVAAVQQDKTAETMTELLKELHEMAGARPITSQELKVAKTNELRMLVVYWQTNALTADRVAEVVRDGTDPSAFAALGRRLAALTEGEVARVASRVIHPDRAICLVIGDRRKIEAGVRALNLGELRVIDADGNRVGPGANPYPARHPRP